MSNVPTPTDVIYGLRLVGEEQYRYVGLTTKTAAYRLRAHYWDAAAGSTLPVHRWIRKNGPGAVVTDVLQVCPGGMDELVVAEIAWITALGTFLDDDGLNCTRGGEGRVGYVVSAETRAKQSAAMLGHVASAETRAKMSAAAQGRAFTETTRAKISAAGRARVRTAEELAKLAASRRGQKHTEEARAKMSAALVGRVFTAEHRAKLRAAGLGRVATEETRAKLRASALGRVATAETRAKISAKGRGGHGRWHVSRGLVNPACQWCVPPGEDPPAAPAPPAVWSQDWLWVPPTV